MVQLVREHCSDIIAEVEESGADLCDLVLIAWALWVILPRCSGAVPKGEASSMVESRLVRDVCFNE